MPHKLKHGILKNYFILSEICVLASRNESFLAIVTSHYSVALVHTLLQYMLTNETCALLNISNKVPSSIMTDCH